MVRRSRYKILERILAQKLFFPLLVLSVINSNCNTSHISNSQLKIQIIAQHTQP